MRGNIGFDYGPKSLVAERLAQHGIVMAEKFRHPQAKGVVIDGEDILHLFRPRRMVQTRQKFRFRRLAKHIGLEQGLDLREFHAGSFSSVAPIVRKCWSSASSSPKGGKRSSRSIIAGTGPKFSRTCAKSDQTSSQTGWSWVSILWVGKEVWPAT